MLIHLLSNFFTVTPPPTIYSFNTPTKTREIPKLKVSMMSDRVEIGARGVHSRSPVSWCRLLWGLKRSEAMLLRELWTRVRDARRRKEDNFFWRTRRRWSQLCWQIEKLMQFLTLQIHTRRSVMFQRQAGANVDLKRERGRKEGREREMQVEKWRLNCVQWVWCWY